MPVGKMVLDRNPENYFAEVEQIAFCPAHMPPGIEASPDKMLQVRTHFVFIDVVLINLMRFDPVKRFQIS